MTIPALFAECVLPGCRNPVDRVGIPCGDCRAAFGDHLQEIPGGRPMSAEQIAERDDGRRAASFAMAQLESVNRPVVPDEPERKRNQTCWLCEERRTCALIVGRWECSTCQEVV